MRHQVLKSKIIIIRHVTMVIKYEIILEMYSPKIGRNTELKSGKSENMCEQATNPHNIYTYDIIIYI